ncbi:hypothetical protein YC2023_110375 [Brassica napus]
MEEVSLMIDSVKIQYALTYAEESSTQKKRTGSIKFCENMEDAIAAASATVEATAASSS